MDAITRACVILLKSNYKYCHIPAEEWLSEGESLRRLLHLILHSPNRDGIDALMIAVLERDFSSQDSGLNFESYT